MHGTNRNAIGESREGLLSDGLVRFARVACGLLSGIVRSRMDARRGLGALEVDRVGGNVDHALREHWGMRARECPALEVQVLSSRLCQDGVNVNA